MKTRQPTTISRGFLALIVGVTLVGCRSRSTSEVKDIEGIGDIRFTVLQLNDVYEALPVEGGKRGGIARVATLRRQLLAENPFTFTVLSGDFLSPSAIGATSIAGVPIAGKHMMAAFNSLGVDVATFGNHEFDLSEAQLKERIAESEFDWTSSNVTQADGTLFPKETQRDLKVVTNSNQVSARVAFVGVTLDMAHKPYVKYLDPVDSATEQVAAAKAEGADVIIALTLLNLADDRVFADKVPDVSILMGGHEHEGIRVLHGERSVPITKSEANAKSVYVHRFSYNTATKATVIDSKLVPIDSTIPEEESTAAVVNSWRDKAFLAMKQAGFEPAKAIATAQVALDGYESSIRNRPTNLCQALAKGLLLEVPQADVAFFNSGTVRIDDLIPPGKITQFDILRMFPFGGKLHLVSMSGETLKAVIEQGQANKGSGGYLQFANVTAGASSGQWLIKGAPLQLAQSYKVVMNDFMMTGQEKGLSYLNYADGKILKISETRDIRTLLAEKLPVALGQLGL